VNLDEFKRSADAHLDAAPQVEYRISEVDLLKEIGNHFPPAESSKSLTVVRSLIHDQAIRHLCDDQPLHPYHNIAKALQLALRNYGTSASAEVDWEAATRAAVRYHLHFPPMLPDDQELIANVRAQVVSKSVCGLRASGYQVLLPDVGGLDMPESEVSRLQAEIDELARKLGGTALVASALGGIEHTYSAKTDRFNLGRDGKTIRLNAKPQSPLAFLYQLGLKYLHCKQAAGVGEAEFSQLLSLLTFAVGILDLESDGALGLMFARPSDILESTRKSLLYDANFCLTQAKPGHVLVFVQWLLTNPPLSCLIDKNGFTSSHVLAAAGFLLQETKSGPIDFQRVPHEPLALLTGLDMERAKRLLTSEFTHTFGKVNRKLTFPLQDSEVDSAFRPLFSDDKGLLLRLPRNLAARATLNAVIAWCRKAWSDKQDFDEALGRALEHFVRNQFTARDVKIHYGAYESNTTEGECDLVIQTESHIVFFEMKGKVLTRQSRSGDILKALEDLADSLARPQAQAMERHAFINEHGKMGLRSDKGLSVIELGSREVLKVSVTRGELLSLHDRPYLQHYLISGCQLNFEAKDLTQQKILDPLHNWFRKFKEAAKRADEYNLSSPSPFARSWSLSLFQVLLLLERTASADDFVKELLRTSRMITPTRDFYATYEYALELEAKNGRDSEFSV
jgi:hypothetical protein